MSGLKKKSIQTLDYALNNPKVSQTEAYLATHGNAKRRTANDLAAKLFNKPTAQIYMQAHVDKAKRRIVELVDSEKEEIALRASDSILNRELGMPTQRTEVQTTGVSLTIDLTSALSTDNQ